MLVEKLKEELVTVNKGETYLNLSTGSSIDCLESLYTLNLKTLFFRSSWFSVKLKHIKRLLDVVNPSLIGLSETFVERVNELGGHLHLAPTEFIHLLSRVKDKVTGSALERLARNWFAQVIPPVNQESALEFLHVPCHSGGEGFRNNSGITLLKCGHAGVKVVKRSGLNCVERHAPTRYEVLYSTSIHRR